MSVLTVVRLLDAVRFMGSSKFAQLYASESASPFLGDIQNSLLLLSFENSIERIFSGGCVAGEYPATISVYIQNNTRTVYTVFENIKVE